LTVVKVALQPSVTVVKVILQPSKTVVKVILQPAAAGLERRKRRRSTPYLCPPHADWPSSLCAAVSFVDLWGGR